jgi:hypothetical protein
MKKVYLLSILFFTLTMTSFGQIVSPAQKVVITKIGATWCPNCGAAAWDNFDEMTKTYSGRAVFVNIHPSSSSALHAPVAIDFAANLPNAWGQPLFYINREKYNTSNVIDNAGNAIITAEGKIPLANTGINARILGNTLNVDAKVQFFKEGNGDYYLSLLIIEDGAVANQANRGSDMAHKQILRGVVTGNTLRVPIANGKVAANSEFEFAASTTIEAGWNADNLEVIGIIWEKGGDDFYEFINVEEIPAVFSTSINFLEESGVKMQVNPTIMAENATIQLDLPEAIADITIDIFNASGQLVHAVYSGDLAFGRHHFSIGKEELKGKGLFFVRLEKDGSTINKKLIVE